MKIYFTYLIYALLFTGVGVAQTRDLKVSVVKELPTMSIVARYDGYDKGGNTSIAFDEENSYKWSGPTTFKAEPYGFFNQKNKEIPYIKRDRDLGQTFTYTGNVPVKLRAVTVSTGYGTNVVRSKMYNKSISLQIFEVTGKPILNDNGSDSTMKAFHGFPHNRYTDSISHIRDDYFVGEIFTSLGVFSGASFPGKLELGFAPEQEVSPDDPQLKGRYLRFALPQGNSIVLRPGKKYAFLIMIDQMCRDCGFTLANNYKGTYTGGHAIRRDGNGRFPPVPAFPDKGFTHQANAKAFESAHFPIDFSKRIMISPGTNGYPDVDTWRDLFFVVEAE